MFVPPEEEDYRQVVLRAQDEALRLLDTRQSDWKHVTGKIEQQEAVVYSPESKWGKIFKLEVSLSHSRYNEVILKNVIQSEQLALVNFAAFNTDLWHLLLCFPVTIVMY